MRLSCAGKELNFADLCGAFQLGILYDDLEYLCVLIPSFIHSFLISLF